MQANKKDFELQIASDDISKDLELGLIGIESCRSYTAHLYTVIGII